MLAMSSLAALADPTRRRIVELLSGGERTAGDIVDRFELSAPAISQHLKVLREAGLVQVRVAGQHRVLQPGAARAGRDRPLGHERAAVLERAT